MCGRKIIESTVAADVVVGVGVVVVVVNSVDFYFPNM